jgi:hypothetical protein
LGFGRDTLGAAVDWIAALFSFRASNREMRRVLLITGLLGVMTAAAPTPLYCCICAEPMEDLRFDAATGTRVYQAPSHEVRKQRLAALLDRYDAVFSGEVVRHETVTATLRVLQSWKGELPGHVTIPTGAMWADERRTSLIISSCDFGLGLGRRYLLFTYGKSPETMRAVGACGPSTDLEHASETIKLLDEIGQDRARSGI